MKHLLLLLLWSIPTLSRAQASWPIPLDFTSSDLPIVVIDTHKQAILDDPKITADLGIIDNGPGKLNFLSDSFNNYNGKIGIEVRGSSSQWYSPKKSFGLETHDASGNDLDVSLLGMPAGSDWILSAAFSDKTLLRNAFTYSLGRAAGSYTSRTRYCEVVLNGVYQGVYTFMEKIKRGADRVNISKLKATDTKGDAVTGGYLLKLDKATGSAAASWTSKYINPASALESGILFQVEYPKLADIQPAQLTYIQAYVDSFETALSTKPLADARQGYRHYINTASFIDYFLFTELSRTVDGYCFSTYFYKDRTSKGGKLTMGPLWDYDLAWANAGFCDGASAAGWVYNDPNCGGHQVPFWWRQLLTDPTFTQELRARWQQLRTTLLHKDSLDQRLDAHAAQLRQGQARNYKAWPIMGTYVWANAVAYPTYEEEVAYVKRWLHDRLDWMDANLPKASTGTITSTATPGSFPEAAAFPVPYTTALTVTYTLPKATAVGVTLLDALGRQVYQQPPVLQGAGSHTLTLTDGGQLPAGLYSVRLSSAAGSRTLRVVHGE